MIPSWACGQYRGVRRLATRELWGTAVVAILLVACGGREHQIGLDDAGTTPAIGGSSSLASGGSAGSVGGGLGGSDSGGGAGGGAPDGRGGTSEQGAAGAGSAGDRGGPSGCVLLVDAARGDDSREGRTWGSALASVGAALDRVASGCEIWLTSGSYAPGNTRASTFSVPDNVTLRGGFSGDEIVESERDAKSAATILSGDLNVALEPRDNTYHVVTTHGTATLDRLTVTGGNADQEGTADENGGGILAGGPLKLIDVTVSGNRAVANGAGVFVAFDLTVTGGAFEHNLADGKGGAIWLKSPLKATIHGSHFEGNHAPEGGGIQASAPGVEVVDASFTACEATDRGGALSSDEISTVLIGRSTFDENGASEGGAIFALGPLSLTSTRFSNTQSTFGAAVVSNSTLVVDGGEFSDNQGAIAIADRGSSCSGIVKNSSFTRNHGATIAGAIQVNGCRLSVSHSSFDSNSGLTGGAIDFEDFIAPGHWLSVETSTFTGNTCQSGGAAIYNWGGDAELSKLLFSKNSGGSAVYAWQSPSVAIIQSRFLDNEGSEDVAGALTLSSSNGAITDSEFARNRSPRAGAILMMGETLYLTNVTVADNVGDTGGFLHGVAGGGLDSYGAVTIQNSIFWGNQPKNILNEDNNPD
ncbi:MAG TPA: hypothetical protein VHM25_05670, partial [Polyangiaceae bacterium]|nr:hypothetical protein [Polyangiaceae bacterium]